MEPGALNVHHVTGYEEKLGIDSSAALKVLVADAHEVDGRGAHEIEPHASAGCPIYANEGAA